jgi:CheY-like chemotaxis protein
VPVPAAAPLRILVAEDNEFNAQLLEQLLVRRGHRVRLATNGREALGRAAEGVFDLLLLDVHMPELDGFQVVQAIRQQELAAGGHLPVIALTARARQEEARPLVERLVAMTQELMRLAGGLSLEALRQQAEAADDSNRTTSR